MLLIRYYWIDIFLITQFQQPFYLVVEPLKTLYQNAILGKQIVTFSKLFVPLSDLPQVHGTQYHACLASTAVF